MKGLVKKLFLAGTITLLSATNVNSSILKYEQTRTIIAPAESRYTLQIVNLLNQKKYSIKQNECGEYFIVPKTNLNYEELLELKIPKELLEQADGIFDGKKDYFIQEAEAKELLEITNQKIYKNEKLPQTTIYCPNTFELKD